MFKIWYISATALEVFLNPGFKITTCFANVARTTANTCKFTYQERFQIIKNMVFIWEIIFNFDEVKFSLKLIFFWKFHFKMVRDFVDIWQFKGYLHYKTIFCNKVAFAVSLTDFLNWSKNNVSLSKYLDFCDFAKCTDLKICDVIISIPK